MRLFHSNSDEQQPRRKNRGCLYSILIFSVIYLALSLIMGASMESMFSTPTTTLDDHTIYRLEMKGTVVEQAAEDNPFAAIMQDLPIGASDMDQTVGMDQLISNIRLAKTNDKVQGIYLDGGQLQIGLASAKALRDALIDYKSSGKFLIAQADNYSELNYYIASVADQVYISPVGMLEWHGFGSIKLYYPRLMEKLGIKMNILKVGTFKSAVEPYFCTKMSDADKQQTMQYLNGAWDVVCQAVAQNRGLTPEQLNQYADQLLELQPQSFYLSTHMVDSLVYRYDMPAILRELTGTEDYHLQSTAAMASVKRESAKAEHHLAVLYAEGEITDSEGDGIVGKKMLKTIRTIAKDEDVKAVVVRVNSPGGSADASEYIWHALQQLKAQGLPIVVSMGDYAASGGYYISCGADYIYAEPTTLTGSIGIFGLVPDVSGLRHRIGVDMDGVGTNKYSTSHMLLNGMSRDEHQLMQSMVERGYDLFTRRCADGRHMTQDAIKQIGEGRVWIGQDALQIGLVDALGNLDDAIVKAAELANIEHYTMTYYPEKKDFLEELLQSIENPTDEEKILAQLKARFSEQRMMALMPDKIIY